MIVTFIILGFFLQFNDNYFENGTTFIKWTFIITGLLAVIVELKKYQDKYKIKGLQNLGVALFFLPLLFLLIPQTNLIGGKIIFEILRIIVKSILFILLIISLYAGVVGIIEICYSIYLNYKNNIKKLILSVLAVLTSF